MARQAMHLFGEGTELTRVYLAAALDEASRVEAVLDAAGVSYSVEAEEYASRTILGSGGLRTGAGFWVTEDAVAPSCDALERAGLIKGLVVRG